MLIALNIVIILFLLGMAALWATYGFFSAFLHMMLVIAAGVLALAFWEPASYMLLGRMPAYAHGVGLLGPFAILLILLRVPFDKYCRWNLHLPRLVEQIGGGVCGFISGVLAFGMLLNGANFLPMAREAMGWEPYNVAGNSFEPSDDGRLWPVARVNEWSGTFFETLSGGAMSPIGGPSLKEARPHLAQRALYYRMPVDSNQFRSAHPDSVSVVGAYAIDATLDNIQQIVDRSAILPYLNKEYAPPEDVAYGADGMGFTNAIKNEWRARNESVAKRPLEMLDIETVQRTARTAELSIEFPLQEENFLDLVDMTAKQLGSDLVDRLKPTLGKDKKLFVVDTKWNNDKPGTYNTDGKLRVAVSQVRLQTINAGRLDELAPIGYSIEYSQNSKARTFTETFTGQPVAFAAHSEFHMGWAFVLPAGHEPVRLFIRELRYDLKKLEPAEGEETAVNTNIGAIARVLGSPALPKPIDEAAKRADAQLAKDGAQIGKTGAYVELNERLPMVYANLSTQGIDKESEPYRLIKGKDTAPRASGPNKKNSIREIYKDSGERLVRIMIDKRHFKVLYADARGTGDSTIRLRDSGGNAINAIGYVLHKPGKPETIEFDIREDAYEGGLDADELPLIRDEEKLYLYFQVGIDTTILAYEIGDQEYKLEKDFKVVTKTR